MSAAPVFFSAIPVTIRPGMTEDEKLLAAWEGVPTSEIARSNPYTRGATARIKREDDAVMGKQAVEAIRRRVIDLRAKAVQS